MSTSHLELVELLRTLDPKAPRAQRHLWLIHLLDWVRGDCQDPAAAVTRVRSLLDAAELRPEWLERWQQWWAGFLAEVDTTPLLADLGFAPRAAFVAELADRLRRKLIWATPETADLRELFSLLFPHEFDAKWLRALDKPTLERLRLVLFANPDLREAGQAQSQKYALRTLLDALSYAISQISAVGQSAEVRTRMSAEVRRERPFVQLPIDFEALRHAVLEHGRDSAPALVALGQLREQLDACRSAASTVYTHLEEHGISVHIEFQLRQLRQRIIRVKALLLTLETDEPTQAAAQLLSHLARVQQDAGSIRALISSSTQLLAAKVTERNAETGAHYISHDVREYTHMLGAAAGGGAMMALTTILKLAIMAIGLGAFWSGMFAGINYAASFVIIMLLGWTVATKQPAMTAPTLAAKLKHLDSPQAHEDFVSEVVYLLRTQAVAIVGNVGIVLPLAFALAWLLQWLGWGGMVSSAHAHDILHDHHLFGPTALFAAATGGLLFASSVVAGWIENWFVFYRIDSVIAYHPRITARLGPRRAMRWGHYWRHNISNWTANVSLGLALGLVPPIIGFFGLPLEVRHVTLVSGQVAVAAQTLGAQVWQQPALWWAAGGIAITGLVNVGVSFYLAFRLALTAQNVTGVNRRRIYAALGRRLLRQPWTFILPMPIRAPVLDPIDAQAVPDGEARPPASAGSAGSGMSRL